MYLPSSRAHINDSEVFFFGRYFGVNEVAADLFRHPMVVV